MFCVQELELDVFAKLTKRAAKRVARLNTTAEFVVNLSLHNYCISKSSKNRQSSADVECPGSFDNHVSHSESPAWTAIGLLMMLLLSSSLLLLLLPLTLLTMNRWILPSQNFGLEGKAAQEKEEWLGAARSVLHLHTSPSASPPMSAVWELLRRSIRPALQAGTTSHKKNTERARELSNKTTLS